MCTCILSFFVRLIVDFFLCTINMQALVAVAAMKMYGCTNHRLLRCGPVTMT